MGAIMMRRSQRKRRCCPAQTMKDHQKLECYHQTMMMTTAQTRPKSWNQTPMTATRQPKSPKWHLTVIQINNVRKNVMSNYTQFHTHQKTHQISSYKNWGLALNETALDTRH